MKKYIFLTALFSFFESVACESHKISVASPSWSGGRSLAAGLDGQYSHYDRVPEGEEFDAFTAQVAGSYKIGHDWLVQFGVPYHDRMLGEDEEAGWGDASLLVAFTAFEQASGDMQIAVDVYAGIKMPTGDSDRLAGESGSDHEEHHVIQHNALHAVEIHAENAMLSAPENGVHHSAGHHLALGSGSWDIPAGVVVRHKTDRWTLRAELQYVIRTKGDYDYQFGNELFARGGFFRSVDSGAGIWHLGLSASAEQREANRTDGVETGSDKSAAYAGPALWFELNKRLQLMAAYDFPVAQRDMGLSGSADQRARAGVMWLF